MNDIAPQHWTAVNVADRGVCLVAPFVVLRENRAYFNAKMTEMANLEQFSHVNVLVSEATRQLAFIFHNEPMRAGARKLYFVGPSRVRRVGKYTKGCNTRMNTIYTALPWLKEASEAEDLNLRRYIPAYDKNIDAWVIAIRPVLSSPISLQSFYDLYRGGASVGLYALYNSQGVLIYYGQGQLYKRVSMHETRNWDICSVSYAEWDIDKPARLRYETELIEEYRKKNGRFPQHNKAISFTETKKRAEDESIREATPPAAPEAISDDENTTPDDPPAMPGNRRRTRRRPAI